MMKSSRLGILSGSPHCLAAGALLAIAPTAFAQVPTQILSVSFDIIVPAAPLSDWLTAGIALLLAATALFALRRQTARGSRLFGWMLAFVTGASLFSVTGYQIVSRANAFVAPGIVLTSSPGTINVGGILSGTLPVNVLNNSGQFARITAITLDAGPYSLSSPTTCLVNTTILAPTVPGNTCVITLTRLN